MLLFDSLIGHASLNQNMLDGIVTAAIKNDEEGGDMQASFSCLAESAGVAVARRAVVNRLIRAAKQFDASVREHCINVDSAGVSFDLGDRCASEISLGKLLLSRLLRMDAAELRRQLDEAFATDDLQIINVICSGLVLTKESEEHDLLRVREEVLVRLENLELKKACKVFLSLDALCVPDLCDLDFGFFRRYSGLLFHIVRLMLQRSVAEDAAVAMITHGRGSSSPDVLDQCHLIRAEEPQQEVPKPEGNLIDTVCDSLGHDSHSLQLVLQGRIRDLTIRCG